MSRHNIFYPKHPTKYAAITIIVLSICFLGKPDLMDAIIELIFSYAMTLK